MVRGLSAEFGKGIDGAKARRGWDERNGALILFSRKAIVL